MGELRWRGYLGDNHLICVSPELESGITLPKSIYPKSSTYLRAKFWSNGAIENEDEFEDDFQDLAPQLSGTTRAKTPLELA